MANDVRVVAVAQGSQVPHYGLVTITQADWSNPNPRDASDTDMTAVDFDSTLNSAPARVPIINIADASKTFHLGAVPSEPVAAPAAATAASTLSVAAITLSADAFVNESLGGLSVPPANYLPSSV